MTTRDKIGIGIILSLMVVLCAVLVWTFKPVGKANRGYEDNVFVQQRTINIQK